MLCSGTVTFFHSFVFFVLLNLNTCDLNILKTFIFLIEFFIYLAPGNVHFIVFFNSPPRKRTIFNDDVALKIVAV